MAERTYADLVALHCHVPDEVTTTRLATRAPGASDAGVDVATAMAATEPPWPEAVRVDTSGSLEAAVVQALAAIRPHADSQTPVFRRPYMEPD
ncbi:hypothetical protein SNL152K_8142 [Streptomyces sp. NL15-2K]|nr:hypothetical protein SNL152K_8142 [Streptomyces sp. NL15-2K]